MENKTSTRELIFNFIVQYQVEHGYAPTIQEIADAMGIKSKATVYFQLKNLEDDDKIECMSGVSRGIKILSHKNPRTNLDALVEQFLAARTSKSPLATVQLAEMLSTVQGDNSWNADQWHTYLQAPADTFDERKE